MASSDWFVPLVLMVGLAILGLAVAGGVFLISSLRQLRREMLVGQTELARHLRFFESRLDRLEGQETRSAGGKTREVPAGQPLPKAWRKEPATASPPGPTLIAVPALAAPTAEPSDGSEGGLAERHLEILELAAAGSSPGDIARQTGQPIGQVELILGLHRQIHSSRGPTDHARAI